MVKRKFLILANPASGKKRGAELLQKVSDRISKEGFDTTLLFTSSDPDFLSNTRKEWDESITDMIAIGGDGTLNLASNILHEKNVILNFIPAGTGNDFVKTINIGRSFEKQFETVMTGKTIEVDAGICNGQLFINGLGLGFDGQIVYDNLNRKSILKGHAKYYAQVLRILATFKPQTVKYSIDDKQYQDDILLLTVANGTTFGGGFRLTPEADISDGLLDITIIRQIAPLRRFWEVIRLTKGTHGSLDAVNFQKGQKITIHGNENIKAHIDGEYFGAPPYEIEILPKHLKIRVDQ